MVGSWMKNQVISISLKKMDIIPYGIDIDSPAR
jgi:hypothetical protein